MARQTKKVTGSGIIKSAEVKKVNSNHMILVGHTLPEILTPLADINNEFFTGVIIQCLCAIYTIFILLQLRLSTTAGNTTVDGSSSFRLYKRKIISGVPGRVLCAVIAIYKSLPFIAIEFSASNQGAVTPEHLNNLVHSYSDSPFPNHKKIVSPNQGNWAQFLNGELTSSLGILLSCPSSNIKKFNLLAESVRNVENPSQILSLIGISSEFLKQYNIVETDDQSTIFDTIKSTINESSGGLPSAIETIEDSILMISKIESKWIKLSRSVSTEAPASSAKSSDFRINILPQLDAMDKASYNSALSLGNKSLISNLEALFTTKIGKKTS